MALYFHGIIITCGTVLALQTHIMRQDFNESMVLFMMMYSYCVSLVLIIIVIQINGVNSEHIIDVEISFILSLDTMTTLGVYFVPKILSAKKDSLPKPNITIGVSNSSLRKTLRNHCNHSAYCTCFFNRNEVKNKKENKEVEE